MSTFFTATRVVMPVVLLLLAGRVFARYVGFSDAQANAVSKLAYWVFLPALLFRDVSRSSAELFHGRLMLGLSVVLFVMALLAYQYGRWARLAPKRHGVAAQGSFRSNMLFVGLPVILYYATSRLPTGTSAATMQSTMADTTVLVALALSVAVPLMNIVSVFLLALPHHGTDQAQTSPTQLVKSVVTNPLVLAGALGYLVRDVSGQTWTAPTTVLGRTLDLAGQGALPAALIAIGASLDPRRAVSDWRDTMAVAFMKLVLMPALALPLFLALGVEGLPLAVGTILLACPTAASSQPMAVEMGGDEALASDIVAVTTFLSPFTLVAWLIVLYALA
jgi:malate permease and related proteins